MFMFPFVFIICLSREQYRKKIVKSDWAVNFNLKLKFGRKLVFTLADFRDRFVDLVFTLAVLKDRFRDLVFTLADFRAHSRTPMFTISAGKFTVSIWWASCETDLGGNKLEA